MLTTENRNFYLGTFMNRSNTVSRLLLVAASIALSGCTAADERDALALINGFSKAAYAQSNARTTQVPTYIGGCGTGPYSGCR